MHCRSLVSFVFYCLHGPKINDAVQMTISSEPIHEKAGFAYAKTKAQISCALTTQLISVFVFATRIVPFLFYLYLKSQASGFLL